MENEKKEKPEVCGKGRTPWFGYILIVLGVVFVLELALDTSILGELPWEYIWPLLVVLLGIHIVAKKK